MIPGVITDSMPSLGDPPDQFWMPLGSLTDHEEGRTRLMPLKDLEKLGSECRVGPIIKRQGDDRVRCQNVSNGSRHVPQQREKQSTGDSSVTSVHARASDENGTLICLFVKCWGGEQLSLAPQLMHPTRK